MLNQSPLFNDVLHGYALKVRFSVNGQHIQKDIILLMVYIQNGQRLLKVFHIQKTQRDSGSNKCKKLQERTLGEH